MKISTRGRYGLKALVDIAANGSYKSCSCQSSSLTCTCKCVNLKSIAKRQGISENYLEQLILPLKKAGFVTSVRGAKGGYMLNKHTKEISVGDILRVLEGPLAPVGCLENPGMCYCGGANCSQCVTKPVWEKLYASLTEVVDSITLEDLVHNYKNIFGM